MGLVGLEIAVDVDGAIGGIGAAMQAQAGVVVARLAPNRIELCSSSAGSWIRRPS